jgi:aspartyl protease family protein
VRYNTAAGPVQACETRVERFEVGGVLLRDARLAVMPARSDPMALLGMSVLRHFRVETQGSTMRLTPLP